MSNKQQWSYSRFSTYLSCKNKYRLQYIKKYKVIGQKQELAQKGLSFHEIAELMTSETSFEQLMELAKKDLSGRDFDQEKYPVLKAIPRLFQYWKEYIIPYEQQGFTLMKECKEFGVIGDTPVIGIMDTVLINEAAKQIRIYDFKTGESPNASSYKSQLLLYAYLLSQKTGIPYENIKLFVFFPMANLPEGTESEADVVKNTQKLMKQILFTPEDVESNIETFKGILEDEPEVRWDDTPLRYLANPSFACNFCDFAGSKTHCPLSYDKGMRFPRAAKVLTKEEYDAYKEGNK